MYIGRFYHKLESKNRLSLPSKFRVVVGERGVLTRGLDGCVALYDFQAWERQIAQLENLPANKRAAREYIRFVTNDAQEVEIDGQGRILLTEELRDQSGITKDVVIVGSHDHIEIWDQQRYHAYIDAVRGSIEDDVEGMEFTTNG